jgi:hypothetical protein
MSSNADNFRAPSGTFRSWLALVLLVGAAGGTAAQQIMVVYDDALENAWADWSWSTTRNFGNTNPVHSGSSSIAVTLTGANGALSLERAGTDTTTYTNLSFWINGGARGGQLLQVSAEAPLGTNHPAVSLPALATNTWQQINLSMSALGIANRTDFGRFYIQDRSGSSSAPTYYVDDILLQGIPPPTNVLATVAVDAQSNRHAISPLVYGTAFATSNQLMDLNFTINRSGGNNETRYNWLINAHNLDNDWYFESYPDSSSVAGASADNHIANSLGASAQPMITIPMIGWMPKLGPSRAILWSYSVAKYGPQTSTDPWRSDAGNGKSSPSGNAITNNDPNDANFPTNVAFQQTYVQHLISRWGASTNGGVRYYIMDNEQSIWQSTHQDVHPVGARMQEILGDILLYGGMVKSNDPNVLVCAPEEWGWPGYFNSGYDIQNPGGNDRALNGGWDYCPWLLNQIYQHDLGTGQRLLDYFTLHCYPAEPNVSSGSDISTGTALFRNQSTRVFWDTNYVDPSWINSVIMLIPRMKTWVASYYPGTKIGITEYNWGAETNINGATAQADILGIFGREGLDLATRWTTPDAGTPTYNAMKMYRNYDGNKSRFGDTSVAATVSTNVDLVSAFAGVRSADGALTVMVINKQLTGTAMLALNLANYLPNGTAQVWQLTANNVISRLSDISLVGNTLSDTLPAQSITLFVLPPGPVPQLTAAAVPAPNSFTFWLTNGVPGQRYVIMSSTDLPGWQPVQTNTLTTSSNGYSFPILDTQRFYRAQWASP